MSRQGGPAPRVGVFGGTFNPVHLAHLILAEQMHESLRLDKVLFVPSGLPPHKRGSFPSGRERLKMVRIAIEGNDRFGALDLEVRRRGPSYTIDTLGELHRHFPGGTEFFFLIGMDAFREITTWHEAPALAALAHFAVFPREGFPLEDPAPHMPAGWRAGPPVTRAGGVRRFPLEGGTSLFLVDALSLPLSATEIRRRVARGKSIRYLVPEGVREHIVRRGLYTAAHKGG